MLIIAWPARVRQLHNSCISAHLLSRDTVRATLRYESPEQANRSELSHFELAEQPKHPMTRYDRLHGSNQHRVCEPKFPALPAIRAFEPHNASRVRRIGIKL